MKVDTNKQYKSIKPTFIVKCECGSKLFMKETIELDVTSEENSGFILECPRCYKTIVFGCRVEGEQC